MGCGCINTCGCNILGDGETTSVAVEGDTFIVSAIPFISGVEDTDCIQLDVDGSKVLRATPIISDDPTSVELRCTVDGLEADVIVDEASTADVSISASGLRVDIPLTDPEVSTGEPGDWIFFSGVGDRADAIDADGSAVPRATYADLWDALSLFETAATRVSLSPIITGIADTRFMFAGMPLEATGFPFGTTILSVDSPTQITADANATTSGSDTEVRAYPYGNGDGVASFNVPDGSRRFPVGFDYASPTDPVGGTGGAETVALIEAELATHDHGVTDPTHSHKPATTTRSFITVDTGSLVQIGLTNDSPDQLSVVVGDPGQSQLNNANTNAVSTGVTVDDAGSSDPHENMPPFIIGRWMVHV